MAKTYDVAVIGAGVFGSWAAYELRRSGRAVALLDAYGPASGRASSGGETRGLRMGYGVDDIYTRWAMRASTLWKEFSARVGMPLFYQAGALWISTEEDQIAKRSLATFESAGVRFERLSRDQLAERYPQISFDGVTWGLLEPEAGVLMARRGVQTVVEQAVKDGVDYFTEAVLPPAGRGRLASVTTRGGASVHAGTFVFACGPWLPKVFPELLGPRIFPTRQEVFFFGVPPGDRRFAPPALPVWCDFRYEIYGMPDLENRGFKVGSDRHGPRFDPDTGERLATAKGLRAMRDFLAVRFPALKDAPLIETRVCQYENTSNGDFLIDHHPDFENVWLVGGGSGHGFKHGPVLGEYVAALLTRGGAVEPRFSLASKGTTPRRAVF